MKKRIISLVLIAVILLLNTPRVMAEGDVVSVPQFTGSGINRYGGLQMGDVTASVNVSSDVPLDVTFIAVLRQRGGSEHIVDIDVSSATVTGNGQFDATVTVPDDKAYSLKLLCWDKDMTELCNPYVLEDYNTTLYSFEKPALLESFDTDVASSFYVWADEEHGASLDLSAVPDGMVHGALRMDYNRQRYGCQAQRVINADWSKYSGMSFYVKGSDNSIVYLRINDGNKTWQYTINPTSNWEEVRFDFADLGEINLSNIKSYTFFFHSNGAADRSGEGYCIIDNIFLTSPVRTVMIGQVLSKELGSCYTDSKVDLYADVYGFGTDDSTYTFKGEVVDVDGNVIEQIDIEQDASEETYESVPITINIDKYGVFKLKLSVNGGEAVEKEFARIPEVDNTKMAEEYRQGYSVHFDALKTDTQIINEADMLKKSGSTIIRQDFLWDIIEPVEGQYDWTFYDKIVNVLTERDIEVLGLITYSNPQNSSMEYYNGVGKGNYRRYPPVDLEKWGRYVYDTVSHYKGTINKWEIWNEANIFFWEQDPDITYDVDKYRVQAYLPLLKVSYLAAKAADPSCIVTMSGMSDIGVGFVNYLLSSGGKDYFDVLNIHPYMAESVEITDSWSDRNFERKITHTRNKAPDLPVYVTEWGWSKNKDIAETNRAIWNAKGTVYSRVTGTEVNTIYSFNLLTDDGMGHIQPSVNGYSTQQFAAVAASNYLIGSYSCVGGFDFGEDTFAAYFEKEGDKPIIALWLTDESITKTVNIKTSSDVTLYDMYGNEQVISPEWGRVTIALDNKPVYLKGDIEAYRNGAQMHFEQTAPVEKNTKPVVQARTDYYFSTDRVLKKGETYTLNFRIVNYSGETTSGTLELAGLPEKWLESKQFDYSIENGKSQIVSVDITPDTDVTTLHKLTVDDSKNDNLEEMTYYFKGE